MGTSEITSERGRGRDIGRGSGRTKVLVEKLEPRSIVIVHTLALVDYVRRMIYDLRGADFARGCSVHYVFDRGQVAALLAGQTRPVAVDHAFLDYADLGLQSEVMEQKNRIEWRRDAMREKTS